MSGLIPQPFIDDLLNKTDLVTLIDSYVPLKKQGNSYVACCPFHNEKNPSFNVITKKQFYHCFGCGVSGNAISFIMSYLNQGFVDAIETLASRLGLTIPREGHQKNFQASTSLYQLLEKVTQFYQLTLKNAGQPAIQYLQGRGITGDIAKQFQLGFASNEWHTLAPRFRGHLKELIITGMLIEKEDGKTYDRYRNRIMFPIHDRNGRLIGFGGRAIEPDQKPKYLNSPETVIFQKSNELYGLHFALQVNAHPDYLIVVEGYMDVIALAQNGIPMAVATLGTATSTKHIQLIAKHTKTIIFCFDGDAAGKQAAWRALESTLAHLESGLSAKFVFLPEGHDPDSLVRIEGKSAFMARLDKAPTLDQFFFETLTRDFNLKTTAGRSQLIETCKAYFNKMTNSPYKQLLLNELSRLTHIDAHRLTLLLEGTLTPPTTRPPEQAITRTPIRVAIALLIQCPELYQTIESSLPNDPLDGEGQELLQNILKHLQSNPNATTATLIEAWRNNPFFEALTKLAAWDHQVPEQEMAKELSDTLHFFEKQNIENKISQFIAKSRSIGLTVTEQKALQTMLQKRHHL